jgi:hypothetical protein
MCVCSAVLVALVAEGLQGVTTAKAQHTQATQQATTAWTCLAPTPVLLCCGRCRVQVLAGAPLLTAQASADVVLDPERDHAGAAGFAQLQVRLRRALGVLCCAVHQARAHHVWARCWSPRATCLPVPRADSATTHAHIRTCTHTRASAGCMCSRGRADLAAQRRRGERCLRAAAAAAAALRVLAAAGGRRDPGSAGSRRRAAAGAERRRHAAGACWRRARAARAASAAGRVLPPWKQPLPACMPTAKHAQGEARPPDANQNRTHLTPTKIAGRPVPAGLAGPRQLL